ncbi:hypothetical protein MPSEU_000874800 [Mayamaea pseudoterrestris]|nr:hypothetical protein MPSEU_000874800 [Mayamaea pseudoterrestris]
MPKETTSMDGTGLLAHEGASAKRHKRNEKPAALDEQHLKVKLDDGHHEEAAFEEQDCNIDHDNDFEQLHMEQSASNSGGAVNSTEWEVGQECASDENEYPELQKLHTYQDEDIFIVKLLGNEFWCNDASIIKHTLGVLLALQQRSIQSALTFAHWNGYALLRGLMKKWDKFEFVQLAALTLLGHTAGNDDQIAERLLAEQGLFESVFSALQQHDNKYMAEAVFCAAAAMAIGNGNVKHIVEEHEGIEKAVATMEEYPNCEPVQSACITFLHAISEDGQFHQRFRKCKGGNMLLRAIDRFSGNDALRNEALAVIAPLLL